ncbi:hypothetical protein QJS10_CPA16g00250 [Acorus calamus]|uniref:Uncharacterized protein n=1 Tax=Acorus calamus TaxID=4465 RepID=A0AAV9CYY9_ACOCL|nr:hypothetical protein QJS10_CPA16g00250 [Acorus calamus]
MRRSGRRQAMCSMEGALVTRASITANPLGRMPVHQIATSNVHLHLSMHQSSPHIDIFITVEHNVHPTPNDRGLENEEMFGEESDEGFDDPMEAFYNFFDKEGNDVDHSIF